MVKYVALLRGIGPGNPNMRNDKLRKVFEDLGFKNVQSVISSGNVVFDPPAGGDNTDIKKMESKLEEAWVIKLGFTSTTIIRSQTDLQKLVKLDPFTGLTHGPSSYLMVTFFKNPTEVPFKLPYQPPHKPYKLVWATKENLCTVTDNTMLTTTDLMGWLEKQFGKQITSRTWLTVQRILKKMQT